MFIPALLNRMSIGPKSRATEAANSRPDLISATSSERCVARRPWPWISAAVCSALSPSSRWQNAISAPSAANARAVARPMPREPPVISAIFPSDRGETKFPGMRIARTRADLHAATTELRASHGSIGLVPTMGALHDGHRALVRASVVSGAATVTSIFVNPLQFGAAEDLSRYPRDEAGDLATLDACGCALVWMPDVATMYPPGDATTITVAGPAENWEGAARPGHFRGVATVCARLFGQVGPGRASFGEKE